MDFSAIIEAAQRGDTEVVLSAIDNGLDVNQRDFFDRSLLYVACHCGHEDMVSALLKCGAIDNPFEQRCSKNALNRVIKGMLEPMYNKVRLTWEQSKTSVTVSSSLDQEAMKEKNEELGVEEMLSRLNITEARLEELSESLAADWQHI